MDLPLPPPALDFSRRRRRWLLYVAAAGASCYCAYRVYNLPAVAERRRRLTRLLRALASAAEATSASAEAVALVSGDLNRFLRGDGGEEIPSSLRKIAKIAASDEFSGAVSRLAEAVTVGVLRGVAAPQPAPARKPESGFADRALDKLFSPAGSGFASAVAGSFATNMVMGFYSAQGGQMSTETASDGGGGGVVPVPTWVHLLCGDKFRQLIEDCIQQFVNTAVAVYLDKTMHINTYDEIFSGLTNPKHEKKVKEVLVSVCNGAVETLIKTSHQVLTSTAASSSSSSSWTDREEDVEVEEELPAKHIRRILVDGGTKEGGVGWVDKVSSTLAVPSNRRLVLDLTGRVTSETVRSFLDFVLRRLLETARKGVDVVRGEVIERGLEVVRYAAAKSMVIVTLCLALCLHFLSGTRSLVPA